MRRYPFERAQPKPTSSETIYIDSDGAEDAVVQPLPKPANPQPMPDIKFPAFKSAEALAPISVANESPPSIADIIFQSKPKLKTEFPDFRLNNANKPAAPDQLQFQASAQAEVLSPTFTTPSRQSEAPTMAPVSYRESSAPELPSFLKTPAPAPQPIAQEEPEISPIAPPIAQSESQVVKPQEKPPELKMEARQPSQMTDEQIAALFSGVRQAPRVSLLSMPVSTKLFSEEYKDAERL